MTQPPWLTGGAAPEAPLRALADPLRRRILAQLAAGPQSSGEVARRLGLPRVNVTHHLGVLADAGLVELRGRRAVLRPDALAPLRAYFDRALAVAAVTGPSRLAALS